MNRCRPFSQGGIVVADESRIARPEPSHRGVPDLNAILPLDDLEAGPADLRRIRAFDFFSGCGGSGAGLSAAGIDPVFAIDLDRDAAASYAATFPQAVVRTGDIRSLREDELDALVASFAGDPILFSACAPCQPFSRQNRQRRKDDVRVQLLGELSRFVRRHRPDFVLLENVPGIGTDEGPLGDFLAGIGDLGYHHDAIVVQAKDHGVPQGRRRLVVLASLHGPVGHPDPTHGPGRLPFRTVRDAISDLPAIVAGETHSEDALHRASRLSDRNVERIRSVPKGGDRRDWSADLELECHRDVGGYTDVYGRMSWDGAAPPLTTRCNSLSNGRFGHPEQDRAISLREAARLQTFPDGHRFVGGTTSVARQIGNAVPPALAAALGTALVEHAKRTGLLGT